MKKIKIISNLPYNLSTKIIIKLLFYNKNIKSIICMIQKELAEKFDYNKNKMNKYKFIIQVCANYKMLFNVSNKVFYPKPKVKSKVVAFKLKKIQVDQSKLLKFTNEIFKNKRKNLRNKISNKVFFQFKIHYSFCNKCNHLNGIYEDTENFTRYLYKSSFIFFS